MKRKIPIMLATLSLIITLVVLAAITKITTIISYNDKIINVRHIHNGKTICIKEYTREGLPLSIAYAKVDGRIEFHYSYGTETAEEYWVHQLFGLNVEQFNCRYIITKQGDSISMFRVENDIEKFYQRLILDGSGEVIRKEEKYSYTELKRNSSGELSSANQYDYDGNLLKTYRFINTGSYSLVIELP